MAFTPFSHEECGLKSRLESERIKCYLKNEFTTQIMNHMVDFVVELQVSPSDLDSVQEILKELEDKRTEKVLMISIIN